MKKLLFWALLALTFSTAAAQQNMKRGHIVTLDGDSVSGMIDYRTDVRNAQVCDFQADGSDEIKTFHPCDIISYHFEANGRNYISKTHNEESYFLEIVVSGQMKLYYRDGGNVEYFYFENEEGKMGMYTESRFDAHNDVKVRQKKMNQVYALLCKSEKATRMMQKVDAITLKTMANVAKTYNKEVWPDKKCQELTHKGSTKSGEDRVVKCVLMVGVEQSWLRRNENLEKQRPSLSENASYLSLTGGIDVDMRRALRGSFVELRLCYRVNEETLGHVVTDDHQLHLQVGMSYQWNGKKAVQPMVHGGVFPRTSLTKSGVYVGPGLTIDCGAAELLLSSDLNISPRMNDARYICLNWRFGFRF